MLICFNVGQNKATITFKLKENWHHTICDVRGVLNIQFKMC